jgi:hypothetical protein
MIILAEVSSGLVEKQRQHSNHLRPPELRAAVGTFISFYKKNPLSH